jgi:ABC-type Mn2+/Zn2+ transport system ATPase subunit
VEALDLEVCAGEKWFVIGPNGSGKTTLLRAVLGLLAPQRGELWLHPAVAERTQVGYVPQRSEWNAALPTTVREFVSLGHVGARTPRDQRWSRLRWALERVGLSGREGEDYRTLSGGQRQRALVARALVRRPRLLILDEPTEELDVVSEASLLDTLEELVGSEGTALLFVTHELELAARRASHVALFSEGRMTAGTRAQVLGGDALHRAFGSAVRLGGHK